MVMMVAIEMFMIENMVEVMMTVVIFEVVMVVVTAVVVLTMVKEVVAVAVPRPTSPHKHFHPSSSSPTHDNHTSPITTQRHNKSAAKYNITSTTLSPPRHHYNPSSLTPLTTCTTMPR